MASAPSYVVSAPAFAPEVAPTIGIGPNCDDCLLPFPIGFTFAFFGTSYDQINIGSNGILGFGNPNMGDGCCQGIQIPLNDAYNNVIALGQNDWVPNAVAKAIRYETRGTAPNRRFVLQYNNVPESGGNGRLTVQVILSEGTNEIAIYTTALSTTLRTRLFTQGIENATGTEAYFLPGRVRASFGLANDAVKFTPPVPNRAPVITAPANISVSTAVPPVDSGTEILANKGLVPHTGICAAVVNPGSPAVIDDAPGVTTTGARNDGLPLDASYPKGMTTITWTAVDAEGLTATATQTITVSDTEIPSILAPANVSTRTDPGASSATVNVGEATVADNCPNVTVTTSRSDNLPITATYSVGITTIQWIAKDASG
ncbi:MAG TPA: HYR domain-containing protein, partial [Gemmatimonadaceae bacterium]|nr:HYR domain-containing protein [Gemmatimonadaceae bacterium]